MIVPSLNGRTQRKQTGKLDLRHERTQERGVDNTQVLLAF